MLVGPLQSVVTLLGLAGLPPRPVRRAAELERARRIDARRTAESPAVEGG
jgi:hypothetical protein